MKNYNDLHLHSITIVSGWLPYCWWATAKSRRSRISTQGGKERSAQGRSGTRTRVWVWATYSIRIAIENTQQRGRGAGSPLYRKLRGKRRQQRRVAKEAKEKTLRWHEDERDNTIIESLVDVMLRGAWPEFKDSAWSQVKQTNRGGKESHK